MKQVYLDNAATTAVSPKIFGAMKPYFLKKFGNPSEPHFWGQQARAALEKAREKVASFLGAEPEEIIFTSCATESINLAHKGLAEALGSPARGIGQPHLIISSIEHKAVLETGRHLEKLGLVAVTWLPVDKEGVVSVSDIQKSICPQTVLVSVMYVNNEVGTIQPIGEIGALLRKVNVQRDNHIYFHTDATQAVAYLDCQVDNLGVDLLSLTGHKLHAPKGVGALYVRSGTPLKRQQDGGGQEMGLRSGTENVPLIVGLGKAMEESSKVKMQKSKMIEQLRDLLIKKVLKIPQVKLTGHPTLRVPHIASFIVEGVEGESMLLLLSDQGIAASTGSACTSQTLAPSHVLTAMGIAPERSHGSLRFSLSGYTTQDEINYVVKVLPGIIGKLRKMAPKF